jgi:UDP-glucose 4-epimerase
MHPDVQMKAVVTGGAGFIGSHTVDLLIDRGYHVTVIDNLITGRLDNLQHHAGNSRCEVVQMDMTALQPDSVHFKGAPLVFHFGGLGDIVPSIERPLDYMRANLDGTLAVLEASRSAGVRKFVYAASSSCYGAAPPLPTAEDAPIRTEYPYALSKYLGECAVLHWGRVYKLPVNSIRIFNAYGPRVRTTGVYGAFFGVFLAQRLKGMPLTIVGDGTQRRDFVYVTDVARAFLKAAETDYVNEIFNVGSGSPQAINRLASLIDGDTVHLPRRPGEPDTTWAGVAKIQRMLDWQPSVPFELGVANMLGNIQDWAGAPVWTPASIHDATKAWFEALSA